MNRIPIRGLARFFTILLRPFRAAPWGAGKSSQVFGFVYFVLFFHFSVVRIHCLFVSVCYVPSLFFPFSPSSATNTKIACIYVLFRCFCERSASVTVLLFDLTCCSRHFALSAASPSPTSITPPFPLPLDPSPSLIRDDFRITNLGSQCKQHYHCEV